MSPLRRRNGTAYSRTTTILLVPFGGALHASLCFKAGNKRSSGGILSMLMQSKSASPPIIKYTSRGGMNMRDIDTRAGWKIVLEATLPLAGSLVAFFLIMAVR
jgi:hypothetical protein